MTLTKPVLAFSLTFPFTVYAFAAETTHAPLSTQGWYAGIIGGIGFHASHTVTDRDTGRIADVIYKKPGWQVGGELGYRSGPMAYEGEFIYLKSTIDKVHAYGKTLNGISGEEEAYAGLLNAFYNFEPISQRLPLSPYLGAGVGYAYIYDKSKVSIPVFGISGVKTQSDNKFAYQGIAGVGWSVTENLAMFLDYRYFAALRPSFSNKQYQNHTINLALDIKLNC